MALIAFNWKPESSQLRWFGLLWLPLFLAALALVLIFRLALVSAWMVLIPLAVASFMLGLLAPQRLRPVFVGLLLLTFPIGFVVSYLVLAVLFFLVITPVALVMRLFGRDALGLRFDRVAESYWIPHPARAPVERYFRQF